MNQFHKPSRKPREEPEGLDAFAASVPTSVVHLVASAPAPAPEPEPAEAEREVCGMNVRFTPTEKAVLVKLAKLEGRSQHQILKRLIGPVILEAGRDLP
jgi:hypothetical protein